MNQQNKKSNHISLLLLTHNEEGNLKKNFHWLDHCPVINEIVVVDNGSTDNTIKILKSLTSDTREVKILSRGLADNFSAQHQFGLSKASNHWVLWLDADEQPTKKFIRFLNHFDTNQYNYSFKRREHFLGHPLRHGETVHLRFIRLFDQRYGQFQGSVHETWQSSKPITATPFIINHHSNPTLKIFLQKINLYSSLRAQELHRQKIKTNLFQICAYPFFKFWLNYLFRLGLLDSTPGIIFALGMSLHSFLVRAKLWHLWQK